MRSSFGGSVGGSEDPVTVSGSFGGPPVLGSPAPSDDKNINKKKNPPPDPAVTAEQVTDGMSVMTTLLCALDYCVAEHCRPVAEEAAGAGAGAGAGGEGDDTSGFVNSGGMSSPSLISVSPAKQKAMKAKKSAFDLKNPTAKQGQTASSMFKTSSMPVMARGKKEEDEHSSDDDEDSDDEDDDVEDGGESGQDSDYDGENAKALGDGDDVVSLSIPKYRRKAGRRKKTEVVKKTQRELDLEQITSGCGFGDVPIRVAARDCAIACVMALDADDDGGCLLVLKKESAQRVLINAMEKLCDDKEVVTACCMLLRVCLASGAKARIKQVKFMIERGLGGVVLRVQDIHEKDVGFINTECSALVEELGTQFERILNPLE